MIRSLCRFLVVVTIASGVSPADAQQPAEQNGMVQLTFPPEMEVRVLVDYVSQRLGVNILFDETVAQKQISIRAPAQVPAESLLPLLESALKMKGLALVDADIPGWKRIIAAADLTQVAAPADEPLAQVPGTKAITQAFPLTYLQPQQVSQIIQPFLTPQGANAITLEAQNLLIVTDYADNLRKIAQLIEKIDQAGPPRETELYQVQHVEAQSLDQQITQILAQRVQPEAGGQRPVDLAHDARTNQLFIVGTPEQIEEVLRLARALDVPLGLTTQVYQFNYIDAERIDRLVQELFDQLTIQRLYRSAVDPDENLLIVTANRQIHERIRSLKDAMDIAEKRPGSGVKFYRLKYADAQEVLNTLRAIEQQGQEASPGFRRGVSPLGRGGVGNPTNTRPNISPIQFVPGANQPDQPGRTDPPATPALQIEETEATPPPVPPNGQFSQALQPGQVPLAPGAAATIVPGAARVTIDPYSNSLIVVADRDVQDIYASLIEQLDRRRPQVMLEAKVVIIDTSDDFSLGVEISTGDRQGVERLLEFTSFGLSQVNPVTGALAIVPGRGFNWTLVDPDVADAVLRALATHRRAKVVSSPRILIEDNASGTLASVTEVPFTSVNASNTVATTSFAGFAEAGTTIEATPRITENDHLQLEYTVSLNSFTGAGGAGVPPPRQTDQVSSKVTIPDGYTVIVGGLNRRNFSHDRDGIPFVEYIPILRELTGFQTEAQSQTSLFVFLRPVILRDDKFRELKYLSDRDLDRATEHGNFPKSGPLVVR